MPHCMKSRSGWFAATVAAGVLMFTACTDTQPEADNDTATGSQDQITIGAAQGLSGNTGLAYLYKYVLEDHGYNVEVQEFVDVAPVYAAVAAGDVDLYPAAWPEHTQKVYWQEHQDGLEDLGAIYDDAELFLAVPEYSEIRSIPDLPEHVDELDGQITGIEPGTGISVMTQQQVMPHYGLEEDFVLELSSTSAMLDELDQAAEIEEDIVVTLWTPFEASVGHDMRALEDPDNIYGDPESVHTLGRNGFTEDFPDVTSMIDNLSLTSQEMAELEHVIVNEPDRDAQADAVQTWIDNQPEILEKMSAGLQSH